jgi:hypothetical protein
MRFVEIVGDVNDVEGKQRLESCQCATKAKPPKPKPFNVPKPIKRIKPIEPIKPIKPIKPIEPIKPIKPAQPNPKFAGKI